MRVMLTPLRWRRREQRVHRARLVLRRQDERRPVAPGRRGFDLAEHEKARGVVRVVLDRARDDGQAVIARAAICPAIAARPARPPRAAPPRRWTPPGPRRRSAGSCSASRGTGRATGRASTRASPPARSLRLDHEVLMHAALQPRRRSSSASATRGQAYGRQRPRSNSPLARRRNPRRPTRRRGRHHRSTRRHRLDRGAEMLAHRLLAEGALGPEVGDANRLLPGPRQAEMISRKTDAISP